MDKRDDSNNNNIAEDNEDDSKKTGGRLTSESISYFKRVQSVLEENEFEDDQHKEAFIKNVFHQIETDGVQLARHHMTSVVLEQVIQLFTRDQFDKFIDLLLGHVQLVCCDRYGSHVVENFCKEFEKYTEDEEIVEKFLRFCKQVREDVDTYLRDMYSSHVIKTLLQVLSGVFVPQSFTTSRTLREKRKGKKKKKPGPAAGPPQKELVNLKEGITTSTRTDKMLKMFRKFVAAIKDDDNFGELLCHHSANPVLQVLLVTLSRTDAKKFHALASFIIQKGRIPINENEAACDENEEDEETIHKLPHVLTDRAGSYLFEVLLQCADDVTFNTFSMKCLRHVITSLSLHPTGNFLVQTLLRCIVEKEQAEPLIKKLLPFTEDILASGHMGCIVRIAEVLSRLEMIDHQKALLKSLQTALHIPSEDVIETSLVKLIFTMTTYEVYYKIDSNKDENSGTGDSQREKDTESENECNTKQTEGVHLEKNTINYHGACLLKSCVEFEKSRLVVLSFLRLTKEEITMIACHPSGSFVVESLLKNKWIKLKQKNKLAEKLKGKYSELARDKYGSRVVDSFWSVVAPVVKETIKEELISERAKLESDMYGRIVLSNCGLNQKLERKKEFMQRQERKRNEFAEVIGGRNKSGKFSMTHEQPAAKKSKQYDGEEVKHVQAKEGKKKKEKSENDRVAKYQAQLKALGIAFD